MKILKFGGKSLNSKEKFDKICKFIKNIYKTEKQLIIVLSAIGNTTDQLCSLADAYGYKKGMSDREFAILLSTGETTSASLFAMKLSSMNIPAKSFSSKDAEILTFGGYLDAKIAYINKSKIQDALNNNIVAVVAGFQGINKDNEITTLGRGGSDITALAIGTIFEKDVEIYSDYNGICLGDPKFENYKKINCIDYDSIISMGNSGAKVLDSRATSIAKENNLTIFAKCSTLPNLSGTVVKCIEKDIISLNLMQNLSKISIVFSNKNKLEKIIKIVMKVLKPYKMLNLNVNNNVLEFFVEQKYLLIISTEISKSLKLLK